MSCCKVQVLEKVNDAARRDEIAKRAYERWEKFGTDETSNWLEAEAEIEVCEKKTWSHS